MSQLGTGIVSVLQTPFATDGSLAERDVVRLAQHAVDSGVDGLLVPVVASEVDMLSSEERERIVRLVVDTVRGRVPVIVGASAAEVDDVTVQALLAEDVGAAAYLVAVPGSLYADPVAIVSFFRNIAHRSAMPLIVQDLEFNGPGMDIETIRRLYDVVPTLAGLKVETVPAGPKYTDVRDAFGPDFWIAGGWAVPQMIEALDRGVDAMIPESAMIPAYHAIDRAYRSGDRDRAVEIFRQLIPVLSFTNQELLTSIEFFKRLLVRKGVFSSTHTRKTGLRWDAYTDRVADELLDYYLQIEADVLSA